MRLRKITKNSTIGIINPAYKNPIDVYQKYDYMFKYFESKGFKLKIGKTFTMQDGYLAGNDEMRANDLMDMFLDDEVDAIVCMRGGYGCQRMIDYLDFDEIKKHPKLICGFSDVTVLLNSIYQKCDIPTLHGLVGIYLGSSKCDDSSIKSFEDALLLPQLGRVLSNPHASATTLVGGTSEGVMVGGNLCLLGALCGSDYAIDFTDKIVFIEEVEEAPYRIDRLFSQLMLNKTIKNAKGFVFGYFSGCTDDKVDCQTYEELIDEYFVPLGKPMISNFACGHSFPFVSIPVGVKVKLDADNKNITIMEEIYEENSR